MSLSSSASSNHKNHKNNKNHNNNNINCSSSCCSYFDLLPDDVVVTIGCWVAAAYDLADYARFQGCCSRMRYLLGEGSRSRRSSTDDSSFWKELLVQSRGVTKLPDNLVTTSTTRIDSLEECALLELLLKPILANSTNSTSSSTSSSSSCNPSFWNENRIGFAIGRTKIDIHGRASGLYHSMERIQLVQRILQKFPSSQVYVDAHSGIAGPPGRIAKKMSHVRGMLVCQQLQYYTTSTETTRNDDDSNSNDQNNNRNNHNRIVLRSWGRQIPDVAAISFDHPYSHLAREGKGWVELYIRCHYHHHDVVVDKEYPPRPAFYNHQTLIMPQDITELPLQITNHINDNNNNNSQDRFHGMWQDSESDDDDDDDDIDNDSETGPTTFFVMVNVNEFLNNNHHHNNDDDDHDDDDDHNNNNEDDEDDGENDHHAMDDGNDHDNHALEEEADENESNIIENDDGRMQT